MKRLSWFDEYRSECLNHPEEKCLVSEAALANALPQGFTAAEETPSTPLLSQEALLTLLLIYLNRKEGTSGSTRIQWGFKGYEYKVLGELTQRGLITNPIGGKKADSLWLTQAGSALGNLIGNMLLPEVARVTKALKIQEEKDEIK